ncbi:MAG: DUF262 domain-containing protein [Cetobacterium sp.]
MDEIIKSEIEIEWALFLKNKNPKGKYGTLINEAYLEVSEELEKEIVKTMIIKDEIKTKEKIIENKNNRLIFCKKIVSCFPDLDVIKPQILLYIESFNTYRIIEAVNIYNKLFSYCKFEIPTLEEVNNSIILSLENIIQNKNILSNIDSNGNYKGKKFITDSVQKRRIVFPIFRLKEKNTLTTITTKEIFKLFIDTNLIPYKNKNNEKYIELFNLSNFQIKNNGFDDIGLIEKTNDEDTIFEDDNESFEELEIEHPFSINNIDVKVAPLTMTNLITRLKYNEIDLNPDFQRNGDLWNRKRMSRLIESILLRLPLPIFYFDVSDRNNWIVIDGLQRLSTIKRFVVEDNLKLGYLEFLTDLNGKKFSELDRKYSREIEEANIMTYQVEAKTPKEVRYSIFNRINTGGMTLNAQEVRQALNQKGNGVNYLKEIVELPAFNNIVHIKSKRMIERELVLRYLGFRIRDYNEFLDRGITLSSFLDNIMEEIDSNDFKEETFSRLKEELLSALFFLKNLFPEGTIFNKTLADNRKTKTLNRSLFEVWTVLASKLSEEQKSKIIENKEEVIQGYCLLLRSIEFDESITKGTNDRNAVRTRFNLLDKFLKGILK